MTTVVEDDQVQNNDDGKTTIDEKIQRGDDIQIDEDNTIDRGVIDDGECQNNDERNTEEMKLGRENDRLQLSLHEIPQKLIKMQNKESEELRQLRSENKAIKIFLNETKMEVQGCYKHYAEQIEDQANMIVAYELDLDHQEKLFDERNDEEIELRRENMRLQSSLDEVKKELTKVKHNESEELSRLRTNNTKMDLF